jgi:hypothetical protein
MRSSARKEILDQMQKLAESRADLVSLNQLLAAEGRRLNAGPPRLPAPVSRALYGTVPSAEAATDLRARYDHLQREGGAAETDRLTDLAEGDAA